MDKSLNNIMIVLKVWKDKNLTYKLFQQILKFYLQYKRDEVSKPKIHLILCLEMFL